MPHIIPSDRSELSPFEEGFARRDAILFEGALPEALKRMVALMTFMATTIETHPAKVAVQAMPNCDAGKHGMG